MQNTLIHLVSNTHDQQFDSAFQLFMNYHQGLNKFNKNEIEAEKYFNLAIKLYEKDLFLSNIEISNYKIIKNLKMNFDKELTIIIGDNGVGKTSILNAIRKHIMWIAASIRKDNASGGTISSDEINNKSINNSNGAYIDCTFNIGRALLHKPICKGFFSDIIFK